MDTDDRLLDPEFRRTVLDDAQVLGVRAAAMKHGISHMTIYRWRKRLGERAPIEMELELLQPRRPGRRRMDSSYVCRWIRSQAVAKPWETLETLRQNASRIFGRRISESVVRKYLSDIGTKPEDRALNFYDYYTSNDPAIELRKNIRERGFAIDWPKNTRRRPGGVILDLLLRISVPRRPSLFVEIAADWLTGRVWLMTHLQEPRGSRYIPINKAINDLKKAGFRSSFVVSTFTGLATYDPITKQIIVENVDDVEFSRIKIKRAADISENGKSWRQNNLSSNYLLTPLSEKSPIYPINIVKLNQIYENKAKSLEENFKYWPASLDRIIEKEVNNSALWPVVNPNSNITPMKLLNMCASHLDWRRPKK